MVTLYVLPFAMSATCCLYLTMEAPRAKLFESWEALQSVSSYQERILSVDNQLISCAGDIRSRLVRLIPPVPPSSPLDAIRRLLAYRLPAQFSAREARDEWRDIVEGKSKLWKGIPTDRKETIRGMFLPSMVYVWTLLTFSVKVFSYILRASSSNVPIKTLISEMEGKSWSYLK